MDYAAIEKLLGETYYNTKHPAALGGVKKLKKFFPGTKKTVLQKWLREQEAYTIHKPAKKRFPRQKTIVAAPNQLYQADLLDVSKHTKENNNVKYLLTVIDVFSKYAFVRPLTSKAGEGVARALSFIHNEKPFRQLQTDKGTEFYNSYVKSFLEKHNIKHYSTENNTIKASIVERFNRTLREKIHRYLTYADTETFIDKLDDFVEAYNKTEHRSTGFAPSKVSAKNTADVYFNLYEKNDKALWAKNVSRAVMLDTGDIVRVSSVRNIFEKGSGPKWSIEVFKIIGKNLNKHPNVYYLEDLQGEKINGSFYAAELQKVKMPTVFRVEKVLKRRKRLGRNQQYVKWLGYPAKFNEWIDASQVVKS